METICMKYQILFSGKNKKNITNLLSAESAQRMVMVNSYNATQVALYKQAYKQTALLA